MQSANEELTTVNDEMQTKNSEMFQLNNDLTNLLACIDIPIVMVDTERKIRRFTPKAGKSLNLISSDVGRPISDLKTNIQSIDLDQLVSEVIDNMIIKEIETQDQLGYWFKVQIRPYRTVESKIDAAVVALLDIDYLKRNAEVLNQAATERKYVLVQEKQLREDAEKANKSKDEFLATLSHELRTPLSTILSWSQLLAGGELPPDKVKRGIEILYQSAKAQSQLVNDLLEVSKIQAGKLNLNIQKLDPHESIALAVEATQSLADLKSIRIESFIDPSIKFIGADPARLQQILWNLLSNSIKFLPKGGQIWLSVIPIQTNDEECIQLQVRDNGNGIKPEFIPIMFQPFTQADSSSTRTHAGLGLGLAIVQKLVEIHHGKVTAESPGENMGATFTVTLPAHVDVPELGADITKPEKTHIAGTKLRANLSGVSVLLVEDDIWTSEVFCYILKTCGADVKTADSASKGFALFEEFKPNILISDISMPGEDGYSLIAKIRNLKSDNKNTPAIALTAYAGLEDTERTIQAGFQLHLAKPVDANQLTAAVARLANRN